MTQHANLENGVAPIWVATGDGAFTPTKNCIGFFVQDAGAVSFVSGGNSITATFVSGQFVTGQISSFVAAGTTATGIYALVI